MKKIGPWNLVSNNQVYDNNWITVNHHEVIDPSGLPGIYGKIHFKNIAIGIIPLDQKNNTWIVGQYRYPLEKFSWEIPEGGGDLNFDVLDSAKRELLEETGIVAKEWQTILECDLSNSVSDERGVIYLARNLSFQAQKLESTEDITLKKIPFTVLYQMALSGKIRDSLSLIGIFKLVLLYPHLIQ